MVNNKSGNIKRGEQQYESIKETIAEFRKKINKHLDHLEKKLYQEIDTILDEEISKASNLITEIEEKKVKLNEMKDQLNAVTTHSSKLQLFLGLYHIEQKVYQCQRFVDYLVKDDRAKEFEIKLKQNYEIDETISKLESLEFIGEVFVDKTEIAVKRETSVRTEAQVESREQSNINNMTMNIETKININMQTYIKDMICLMDGRFIVVEDNGKVNLLSAGGKLEKKLTISGKVVSVAQINHDTIAITDKKEQAIKIFKLENETVIKVITLNKTCYGLSFANNSLVVGLDNNEIRIIDLEGYTLKSIQVQSRSTLDFLILCNDRVIYSDYKGKTIYCVGESGTQIWEHKQDSSFPCGLFTDLYGNIFVADCGSNRIIVISKDGQDSKVLISKGDGLTYPCFICFKHNESSGIICDFYGKYLAKFNLSCR